MLEKSCIEFMEVLASKEPVPGGGGACAYAGALGMALGCMVGNLTLGKKKYADVQEEIKELLDQGYQTMEALKGLVQADAEAFYPLSQAYGLPSTSEEEKAAKEAKLQEALVQASLVPLEIARQCCKAIQLHSRMARIGNKIAISDVGVGVAFCEAALRGAKLNVLINTQMMKDQSLKNQLESELEQIVAEFTALAGEIFVQVESSIRGG